MTQASKGTVLIVEDDTVTRTKMTAYLAEEGYRMFEAGTAREALDLAEKNPPDVVLLDLNLPDESGMVVARELRSRSDVGIIIVTGRQDDTDRIVGLEVGADDYITKPINLRELMVRVRNLRRRVNRGRSVEALPTKVHTFSGWTLNEDSRELINGGGESVYLTRGEFTLLSVLIHNAGRALSRDALLDHTVGYGEAVNDRTIDVLIGRLRRKIEEDARKPKIIQTVYGFGYKFFGGV